MKEISSKTKTKYVVVFVLFAVLSFWAAAYLFLNVEQSNWVVLILGLLLSAFGSYVLSFFISAKELILTKDALKVKSHFFSNSYFFQTIKIPYSEILGYTKIEKRNEHFKWQDLTILTKQGKFTIHSNLSTNYEKFRSRLARKSKQDKKAEHEWHLLQNRRFRIGFMTFAVLFFVLMTYLNVEKGNSLSVTNTFLLFMISLFFFVYGLFIFLKK